MNNTDNTWTCGRCGNRFPGQSFVGVCSTCHQTESLLAMQARVAADHSSAQAALRVEQQRATDARLEATAHAIRKQNEETALRQRYERSATEIDAVDRAARRLGKASVTSNGYSEALGLRARFARIQTSDVDPAQRRSLADIEEALDELEAAMKSVLGVELTGLLEARESIHVKLQEVREIVKVGEGALRTFVEQARGVMSKLGQRGYDTTELEAGLDKATCAPAYHRFILLRESMMSAACNRVGDERECTKVWGIVAEYRAASVLPVQNVATVETLEDLERAVEAARANLAIRGDSPVTAFALDGVEDTWVDTELAAEFPPDVFAALRKLYLHAHARALAARRDVLSARTELAVPTVQTADGTFFDVAKKIVPGVRETISTEQARKTLARLAEDVEVTTPGWGGWTAAALGWLGMAGFMCVGGISSRGGTLDDAHPVFVLLGVCMIPVAMYMHYLRMQWWAEVKDAVETVSHARTAREQRAVENVMTETTLLVELYEAIRQVINRHGIVHTGRCVVAEHERQVSELVDEVNDLASSIAAARPNSRRQPIEGN